jgi:hypothetical protein
MEETGFKPQRIKLWKRVNPGGKIDHDIYIFIARNCTKIAEQTLDEGEKIQPFLYAFEEFLNLWKNPNFIEGTIKEDLIRAQIDKPYKESLKKTIMG